MADCLIQKLRESGFAVEEDDSGRKIGGNAGNVYGFLKGSIPGTPILLSAHMDTVEPSKNKQAMETEDGRIQSAGGAVLGADDVAGIVEILEGIRSVRESGAAHRDIEVLFPPAEERYAKGSSLFDYRKIRAREAYVLDMSGRVGSAAYKAPTLITFQIEVKGKATHAGFEPERGIHAIAAAALVVTGISQGHVDEETTCNIGHIEGGTAANIVPDKCCLSGEIRSFSHEKAIKYAGEIEKRLKQIETETGAFMKFRWETQIYAYETDRNSVPAARFKRVCGQLGLCGELRETFGGSDNNNFARHQIPGLVLSCGMYQVHSTREYTRIEDLISGARLVAGLVTDKEK